MLAIGFFLLFAGELFRVYLIMPFPGSQTAETIGLAYFLHRNIMFLRILGLLLIASPAYKIFISRKWLGRIVLSGALLLYAAIIYFFNFRFMADKMFYQPRNKNIVDIAANNIGTDKLVVGVVANGEARAYPLEIIGYHHQLQDTVGGDAVIITYCTVCRTGRVYKPFVNGVKENFRLVGMDHFNAMFEDEGSKSWWYQATGKALVGPLKGASLEEVPSQQLTLAAWLRDHPRSLILQPDTNFRANYDHLRGFDDGSIESGLEKRDTASWQPKSWIIGVQIEDNSKAYDWNRLVRDRVIVDSLAGLPLLLTLEKDDKSFHLFNRYFKGSSLHFILYNDNLIDDSTKSIWNENGVCIEGLLKGEQLAHVQASQEFWHSWQTFHHETLQY
jgi:hypothetical protein